VTQPFVTVPAPATTPYRHGLFSAAALVDPADQREFNAGVLWEPNLVDAPASATTTAASDPARPAKTLPEGVAVAQAGPVVRLYTGLEADLVGRDDHVERARARLGLVEQQSLEQYAWTGAAGNRPRLADAATQVLGGAAVPLAHGIGLLEEWISDKTGVLGAIWAPRYLAGAITERSLVRPDSARLIAPLGDPVIFAHTTGVGPTGAAPAAGTAWLYATGPVMVRRSAIVGPRLEQAHDRTTNSVFAIVERFYTVGWSGGAAAVQVQLSA
jgi:hypothetical protein